MRGIHLPTSTSTVGSVSEFNISHHQYGIRRANFDPIIDTRLSGGGDRTDEEFAFRCETLLEIVVTRTNRRNHSIYSVTVYFYSHKR